MHSGRTHSTRHHLTRTVPPGEQQAEPVKESHATERLRHLRRDFEIDDRFRR
jgi:hypothetical protein